MRVSAAVSAIVLAIVYQSVAAPLYVVSGIPLPSSETFLGALTPDFVLLTVLVLRLVDRSCGAVALAAGAGLAVEWVSIDPWGSHVVSYAIAAWVLAVPAHENWAESVWLRAPCLAVAVAAAALARAGILWLHDPSFAFPSLPTFAARVGYNAFLGTCLFVLIAPWSASLVRPSARALRPSGGAT